MPRDRIRPERPSVSGETPVRYRLWGPREHPQMVTPLSKEGLGSCARWSNPIGLADNLRPTRIGWQHKSPWWYSDAKRQTFVSQLTQALSATYLANPLIEVRSIPHRSYFCYVHKITLSLFAIGHWVSCQASCDGRQYVWLFVYVVKCPFSTCPTGILRLSPHFTYPACNHFIPLTCLSLPHMHLIPHSVSPHINKCTSFVPLLVRFLSHAPSSLWVWVVLSLFVFILPVHGPVILY